MTEKTVELAGRLRTALTAADYTYDGVAELLGPVPHAALSRNETMPGLRATSGGTPIETLTRLWLLQATVSAEDAERALPGLVDELCSEGILERSISEVAARVDLRPYGTDTAGPAGNLWVTSDLTPGLDGSPNRVGADHVLGISSAATSLAQLTIRSPVDRALDLGTGCGVQSLHLATHARQVVATDVNTRALWLTRLNAALNEISTSSITGGGSSITGQIDVREGSFFEPVAGEKFDLIVTNPPFVISPATGERLVYRDSGLPGDRVVEHIVRTAPKHLNEGGWCQILANWVIPKDQPWEDRMTGWLDGSGCDAWVVQREVVDLPSYVELWLKDAGLHGSADYHRRYDTWLSWFEDNGVEAVGFGWINLRATGGSARRLEEWPYEVEQPLGVETVAWSRRTTTLARLSDEQLLNARPATRIDVRQETLGAPGAEDPSQIVLRQQVGMRRARQVDTVEAALVGACDGELSIGQILAALEQILGETNLAGSRLDAVRELVAEGWIEIS
ncbi:MAG: methyltransferase small [Marmoricola sp.]|nr:methyltransferase small [Marmoricola sp.]